MELDETEWKLHYFIVFSAAKGIKHRIFPFQLCCCAQRKLRFQRCRGGGADGTHSAPRHRIGLVVWSKWRFGFASKSKPPKTAFFSRFLLPIYCSSPPVRWGLLDFMSATPPPPPPPSSPPPPASSRRQCKPQAPDGSVPHRTSTLSSRWQGSPPDLNCQNLCQIECQNLCQIECQNQCEIQGQNVCLVECQNLCQIECQILYQIECQNLRPIECQNIFVR